MMKILQKFPTTETCPKLRLSHNTFTNSKNLLMMKVSEYFISTSSSTLAIGRGAEIC